MTVGAPFRPMPEPIEREGREREGKESVRLVPPTRPFGSLGQGGGRRRKLQARATQTSRASELNDGTRARSFYDSVTTSRQPIHRSIVY